MLILYTGGASRGNPGKSGAGAVVVRPSGQVLLKVFRYLGNRTCHEAEYEALRMGLKRAVQLGFDQVTIRSSSELMVNQLTGAYSVKSPTLQAAHAEALALLTQFNYWQAEHAPRHTNKDPYRLANKAIDVHAKQATASARSMPV
jgi:ribonuclease HI